MRVTKITFHYSMRRSMDYQKPEVNFGIGIQLDEGEMAAEAYARAKASVFIKVEADVEEAAKVVVAASEKADREKADNMRAQIFGGHGGKGTK